MNQYFLQQSIVSFFINIYMFVYLINSNRTISRQLTMLVTLPNSRYNFHNHFVQEIYKNKTQQEITIKCLNKVAV